MSFASSFIAEFTKLAQPREWRRPKIERQQQERLIRETVRKKSKPVGMGAGTAKFNENPSRPPPIRHPIRKPVAQMPKVTPPVIKPNPNSPF